MSELIDPNVKYGYTYFYKARQLFRVEIAVRGETEPTEGSDGEAVPFVAYVASRSPAPAIVRAVEKDPPPPPGILFGNFIYKSGNGIRLDWARPNNPTRDIKKYQVFRRRSLREPFEIIAEYDFSDPEYTGGRNQEQISRSLITESRFPVYHHIDREFNRESSYIYCIASVDAHGLVSNYGTQMQFVFDRSTNTMSSRKLSRSGAPRSYPNYYVDPAELEEFGSDRLIEDVIKDSRHGTMRIYFDPTVYRYTNDSSGERGEANVLGVAGADLGNYKFQIINLDRQVSRVLTIQIDDEGRLPGLLS